MKPKLVVRPAFVGMPAEIAHVDAGRPRGDRGSTRATRRRRPAARPEGGRAGAGDPDVDEVAGRGRAGEVHGGVAARPAPQERCVGAARALHQHLLGTADARPRFGRARPAGRRRRAVRSARGLTSSATWPGHRGRVCTVPRAVDKGEGAVEADVLDHLEGLAGSRRSVSPGKPTMMSVVSARSGMAPRMRCGKRGRSARASTYAASP